MIQVQTLLKVADNSGGKVVRCLKIIKKGTKPRYGKIGDVIVFLASHEARYLTGQVISVDGGLGVGRY